MAETIRRELNGTFIMDTDAGPLAIMNTNYVDQKLLTIYKYVLDEFCDTGHGLSSIIFRADGYPSVSGEDLTIWVYQPDAMAAVANLRHIVKAAIDITMNIDLEDAAKIGIKTLVWMNLVKGFLHELYHAQSYMIDRPLLDSSKDARLKDEEDAETYSNDKLISLAQEINIEPIFGEYIENLIHKEYSLRKAEVIDVIESIRKSGTGAAGKTNLSDDDEIAIESYEKWIKLQDHMFGSGQSWYTDGLDAEEDGEPIGIDTFKEYMCWMDSGDMADKEWAKNTLGVKQFSTATPPPAADGKYYQQMEAHQAAPLVQNNDGWVSNNQEGAIYEEDMWEEDFDAGEYQQPAPTQQQYNQPPSYGNASQPAYTAPAYQAPQTQQYQVPQQGGFTQNGGQYQAPAPVTNQAPPQYQAPQYQAPQYKPDVKNMAGVMSGAEMGNLMQGLYRKLFDHIFLGCQWDKVEFRDKSAIQTRIALTSDENKVITSMVTQTENGSYVDMPADGFVAGKIMDRNKELPGYEIKFIDHNGNVGTRKLLPQNPKKTRKDGSLSYTAEMAQHGWQIMWIINPDEGDKQYSNRMMRDPDSQTIKMEHNRNGRWE